MHLIGRNIENSSQTLDVGPQRGAQFLFGKAADGGKGLFKRDVRQIVDSREDAQLREFRNACDEAELDILLVGFERHVKLLHDLAHGIKRGLVMEHVKQRRVVFVDDHCHLLARFLIKSSDETFKFLPGSFLVRILLIYVLSLQQQYQRPAKFLSRKSSFGGTQIEVDDRIRCPFLLELHDLQPFKQLAVAFEIRFQG